MGCGPEMVPAGGGAAARAVVVFTGETGLKALGLLRRGFRHCFVAVLQGGRWVTVDPLAHRIWVAADVPEAVDLPGFWRRSGFTTVELVLDEPPVPRRLPLAPLTCVSVVKRVIGLRAPFVLTPYQLHRRLARTEGVGADRKG